MTKIVTNACFGGFGLSTEAIRMYLTLKNSPYEERLNRFNSVMFCEPGGEDWSLYDHIDNIDRTDPHLVEVVETLGAAADGDCARLRVTELPSGTRYRITEYDGRETIELRDSIDWEIA
jgi:hypothetical protein